MSTSRVPPWGTGGKLLATLCLAVVGLIVPFLEISDTHLFNPAWHPHARLHEAWQLATNTALSLFAMCLVWGNRVVLACFIGMLVNGGFLLAWMTKGIYGGSMVGTSAAGAMVAGMDAAVLIVGLSFLVLTLLCMIGACRRHDVPL